MRGASAAALATLTTEIGSAVEGDADAERLAVDLFAVSALLETEHGLRRVLTDVSTRPDAKSGLVRSLFESKLDDAALSLVAKAAEQRWAGTRDLGTALEVLGVIALVKGADKQGQADDLENDLFSVARLVQTNPELRDVLSDPTRSNDDKRGLLRGLLEDKVGKGALRLAEQAVAGSHRNVGLALEEYQEVAAANRDRLVATARVARPLDDASKQRLDRALGSRYGKTVHTNVVVDPEVIGGIRVEIGDEVIDGTVSGRLDDARRRLAG